MKSQAGRGNTGARRPSGITEIPRNRKGKYVKKKNR